MEQSPFSVEDASDGAETKDNKKKKKAEALGAMLITEPRAEKQEEKRPNLFEQLTRRDQKQESAPENAQEPGVETGEDEQAIDELSPEETRHIERELVEVMQAKAPETGESGDESIAEEEAAVQAFRARVIEQDMDSDEAFEETLDELEAEDTESETADGEISSPEEEIVIVHEPAASEAGSDSEETTDDRPAAGGSGAGTPPPPPVERGEPPHSDEPDRPTSGAAAVATPAQAPVLRPSKRAEYVPQYDEGNTASAALMGGIIGYLIGRRRGRIKTEKKLLPVQKKLEKQVNDLQWQLKEKETKIRQTVREKQYQVREAGKTAERVKPVPEKSFVTEEDSSDTRGAAAEAGGLHSRRQTREHIGQVLLLASAEALPKVAADKRERGPESKQEQKSEALPNNMTEKQVMTLNRSELMKLSEKIVVDGSSLRQIYETHLVGEHGLRRLVAEHLRGGNVKKALRQEIVEREIDFERDPVMRDRPGAPSGGGGAAKSPVLQTLLKKAGADVPPEPEDESVIRARAAFEEKQDLQKRQQQRTIDVVLAGTILFLLALVLFVLFR